MSVDRSYKPTFAPVTFPGLERSEYTPSYWGQFELMRCINGAPNWQACTCDCCNGLWEFYRQCLMEAHTAPFCFMPKAGAGAAQPPRPGLVLDTKQGVSDVPITRS